jgi:hypothetical protein
MQFTSVWLEAVVLTKNPCLPFPYAVQFVAVKFVPRSNPSVEPPVLLTAKQNIAEQLKAVAVFDHAAQ